MTKVEVEKARELGFCFGVRRAIKIIEKAAEEHRRIVTLGPVVHNTLVVARLANAGIRTIDELDQIKDEIVAITSHGISPQLLSRIQAQKLPVIDTTCPTVRNAQKTARKLADAGFTVIIFGETNHPEVRSLLGWAGKNAIATMEGEEIATLDLPPRLGIISQTTQSRSKFAEFIHKVTDCSLPRVRELRVVNTLCEETQKRQAAALELASRSDLIIVVGGRNSANTQRLSEICSPIVETHLIETASEIRSDWLSGKRHIGVTAGASTPDEAIEEVMLMLDSIVGSNLGI